jgi:hypothetical protein
VLGSSKAVNAACLAVFDPSTNSALSRQLGSAKKMPFGGFPSCALDVLPIISSAHAMIAMTTVTLIVTAGSYAFIEISTQGQHSMAQSTN